MKQNELLKIIDRVTSKAIKQIEKDRTGRRNYFTEILKYCELVSKAIKKYLN